MSVAENPIGAAEGTVPEQPGEVDRGSQNYSEMPRKEAEEGHPKEPEADRDRGSNVAKIMNQP